APVEHPECREFHVGHLPLLGTHRIDTQGRAKNRHSRCDESRMRRWRVLAPSCVLHLRKTPTSRTGDTDMTSTHVLHTLPALFAAVFSSIVSAATHTVDGSA